jgi:hypothetical protein
MSIIYQKDGWNMNKIKYLLIILIINILFINSCSSWDTKKWNELKDRNFHFQKFKYFKKGINKKYVFEKMKNFPTEQILKILSHKYNIIIDSSEFEDFILSENISEMQVEGLIADVQFTWEDKNKHSNILTFEFIETMSKNGITIDDKEYNIIFQINQETIASFRCIPDDRKSILINLARSLDYSRLNQNSDDYYINNKNKTVVNLMAAYAAEQKKIKPKISKEFLKQQIKEYMSGISQEEKKIFRDDIIKFLYYDNK